MDGKPHKPTKRNKEIKQTVTHQRVSNVRWEEQAEDELDYSWNEKGWGGGEKGPEEDII